MSVPNATRAVRRDPVTGARDEVEFFGEPGALLFGCTHLPPGPPVGGLVVCPGFHAELIKNYHLEVLLGRALAARGIAVQRFHYRGSGHSDWSSSKTTFGSMTEDAVAAADHLAERTGVESIAFLGTRWGSFHAAAAAAPREAAPLVLWDPVLDASRYFRDVFRIPLVHSIAQGVTFPPIEDPEGELQKKGFVDVVGFPIGHALYESAAARSLADEIGPDPHPILLVQMRKRRDVGPGYARLCDELRSRGCAVDVEILNEEPAWWLFSELVHSDRVIDPTVAWLTRLFGAGDR